ncbi:YoaK family protein [Amnibacterium sp. CER49]|uniref:YoaK family protein n=1 Tax=Amnibacterium sp. CER49 TaxID=3039161 RepID=UPI002448EFAB|nr:YoaK family protein [Amnibacterium sp. CER49]MDH2442612.1 YoaK family protein [Amnibacterium sp. CER49]
MSAPGRAAGTARRHALVVALTFVTGTVDALGFTDLGGAFSSVMTGNMVLLGIRSASGSWLEAGHAGLAILSFVLGVLGGARIAGHPRAGEPVWPRRASVALGVEAVLLGGVAIVWIVLGGAPGPEVQQVLLALCAAALGVQSSAVQRLGVSGLSSTYLTGTLTTLVAGVAARRPAAVLLPSLLVLAALVVGAGAGWAASAAVRPVAPLVALVPFLAILSVAALTRWAQPTHVDVGTAAASR